MPCAKRVACASGAHLVRRAERLARNLPGEYRVKREVINGYILEGRRAGDLLSETVIDPESQVMLFGFGLLAPTGNLADGSFQFNPVCVPITRDNLHWDWRENPARLSERAATRYFTGRRAALRVRDEADASTAAPYNAFEHGAIELEDGYRASGLSTTNSHQVGTTYRIMYYRSPLYPTFYSFGFSLFYGFPNGSFSQGAMSTAASIRNNMGLSVDSEWLEGHVGGQVVMDWINDDDPIPTSRWTGDSPGGRWQAPWCGASLIGVDGNVAHWQLVTRIADAPLGEEDYWSSRRLAVFRVDVNAGDDPTVSPTAAVSSPEYYDPALSDDLLRRPQPDDPSRYYLLNTFAAPAVCPGGAMVIGQVVRHDFPEGIAERYHAVLVTMEGEFVELALASDDEYGRSKTLFAGGDLVDGTPYLLNPFMQGGLVVVNGNTGALQVVTRPTWRAPLDTTGTGVNAEDHLRNIVSHIGGGVLAFPVADNTGLSISMATYNTQTGAIQIVGPMWTAPYSAQRGGVSKIGVVQQTTEDRPAVLLAGFHSGVDGRGATYISHDGGASWQQINNQYGPSRGVVTVGNGLYLPKPGRMWESA